MIVYCPQHKGSIQFKNRLYCGLARNLLYVVSQGRTSHTTNTAGDKLHENLASASGNACTNCPVFRHGPVTFACTKLMQQTLDETIL